MDLFEAPYQLSRKIRRYSNRFGLRRFFKEDQIPCGAVPLYSIDKEEDATGCFCCYGLTMGGSNYQFCTAGVLHNYPLAQAESSARGEYIITLPSFEIGCTYHISNTKSKHKLKSMIQDFVLKENNIIATLFNFANIDLGKIIQYNNVEKVKDKCLISIRQDIACITGGNSITIFEDVAFLVDKIDLEKIVNEN